MKTITNRLALIVAVIFLFSATGSLFASEEDSRIESAIKESYVFKAYVHGDDIIIESKDGAVTLTGTVFEESHKILAGEIVAGQPGVKRLDNKLKVKGETPDVNSDERLTQRVKSTLWFHRNINVTETEVIAKDGAVTLRGESTSTAQKDLTTEYAKDVEGVKSVTNEMVIVLSATAKPGGTTKGQGIEDMTVSIDDVSITALVKSALSHHRSTSALRLKVETKEGVVKLQGKVKNAAEKDLAGKLVNDVHGVKTVVNEITIE